MHATLTTPERSLDLLQIDLGHPRHVEPEARGDTPLAPLRHSFRIDPEGFGYGEVAACGVNQGVPHGGQHIAIMMMPTSTKRRYAAAAPAVTVPGMAGTKPAKSSELRALIGRRLAAARKAYNPNQAEAARDLDLDPRVLSNYERGLRFPDEAFVVRFWRTTGCPADWLYLGRITSEMPPSMAALIGVIDPDLVPAASPQAGPAPAPARASAAVRAAAGRGAAGGATKPVGVKKPEKALP